MIQSDKLSLDFFDNALLDENIPFRDEWKKAGYEHDEALWSSLHSYLLLTQRAYYKFEPKMSYVPGEGNERYNYGTYIHLINVRAKDSRRLEFENFVRQIMKTTAFGIMPHREPTQVASNDNPTAIPNLFKLNRFVRVANLHIRSDTQIKLQEFMKDKLLGAAKKLGISLHYYRVGFGKDEFCMILLPFEELSGLHGIKNDSIFPSLFAKAFPKEGAELTKQFYSYLWKIEESVNKTRPDISTLLGNRYVKSWW